jgi:hypothetical protein
MLVRGSPAGGSTPGVGWDVEHEQEQLTGAGREA